MTVAMPARLASRHLALPAALCLALAGQARAEDAAATTGGTPGGATPTAAPTIQLGDLRGSLGGVLGGSYVMPMGWTTAVSADLQELATDNAFNVATPRRADLITTLRPSLAATGQTGRLALTFTYAPGLVIYTINSRENRIDHELASNVHAVLVPDTLLLDLHAFATQGSNGGGFGPSGTVALTRAQTLQTTSFSASPTFVHDFGSLGSMTATYNVIATNQQTLDSGTTPAAGGGTSSGNGARGLSPHLLTQQESMVYQSGEDAGRLSHTLTAQANQADGPGQTGDLFAYDLGYAVNRLLTLSGRVGYQDTYYGTYPGATTRAYAYHGVTWNVAATASPGPDSTLTLRYGQDQGLKAFNLTSSLAPTARLHVSASYSDTLTSDQQALQQNLSGAGYNASGVLVNSNGVPVMANSNFYGTNRSIYEMVAASVNASLQYDRDVYSVMLSTEKRTPVGGGGTQPGAAGSNGAYATVSWGHTWPYMQTTLYAQYGYNSGGGGLRQIGGTLINLGSGNTTTLVTTATASYPLSDTLTGNLQYSFTQNESDSPGQSVTVNTVLLGIHKQF